MTAKEKEVILAFIYSHATKKVTCWDEWVETRFRVTPFENLLTALVEDKEEEEDEQQVMVEENSRMEE